MKSQFSDVSKDFFKCHHYSDRTSNLISKFFRLASLDFDISLIPPPSKQVDGIINLVNSLYRLKH